MVSDTSSPALTTLDDVDEAARRRFVWHDGDLKITLADGTVYAEPAPYKGTDEDDDDEDG